ncbi:MAG: AAA family ATPase, partial [Deltaproteobacteria bacterium]|nr:AAA family ATPase [Deltaproteobacteria bacterium]
ILVDQDSKKECGEAFEFDELEPIQVKGKTSLIPVARPKLKAAAPTQKEAVTQSHPMIGRHREFRALREAWKHINDANACHVYTVLGEAGQGKTSLIQAMAADFKAPTNLLAISHASSLESKTPYLVWRNLLWKILAPEASDTTELKTTLEILASDSALGSHQLALLNDIIKIGFPETEVSQTFSKSERQKRLSDAVVTLLEHQAGQKSILLAFEDAQWMDDKSWSLLDLVAPRLQSTLFIISLRENAITENGRESTTFKNAKDINLPPMSKGEISELIKSLTQQAAVSTPLSDLVSQKSGGSPYLATEMVRTLQEENLLVVDSDQLKIKPGTDTEHIAFPTTIEGFVNSRIDKLPPREQLLLKVASVLGDSFHQDIIKEIYPVAKERPQVRFLLEKLVTRGFLKHHSERVQALFHFEQSTILEVAYENMLFEKRRQIHKASAKWYEAHKSNEFQNYLPLIAHHWEAAGHPGKALKYLEKASIDAAGSSNHSDVIRHATQGLLVAERGEADNEFKLTPTRALRLHRLLADAHFAQGDIATSQEHALSALDSLGLKPSNTSHALGGLQNFVQTSLASRGHGKTKEAILAEASRAASRLAMCYMSEQNEKAMRAAVELSVSLAGKANEHPATTGVLTIAGTVMGAANNHKKALTYFEQAKSVGTKHKNMTAMIQLSEAVASHAIGKGDWDRAKEAISQASKQLKKHGSRQERDRILYARANLSLLKGKFSDAQDRFQQLSEFARRHKGMGIETRALCGLARTHLALGNYIDAEKCVIQATKILELAPNKSLEILCLGLQSTSQLRQGNISLATANVKQAGKLLKHNTMSHYDTSFSRVFTAEACMDLALLSKHGKIDHASKHEQKAKQALSYLHTTARQWLVLMPALKRLEGHWELLHDNYSQARKNLEKSLALSRRFEMRMDEALALMDLGRCRGVSLSQQRQYLTTSQSLLTLLNCHNRALTAQRALETLNG